MKSKRIYYLCILAPVILLIVSYKTHIVTFGGLMVFTLVYLLIYRTFIDGLRLAEKGIIKRSEIWKLIIPGTRIKYFKDLYLN